MSDFMAEIDAATAKLSRGDLLEGKILQLASDYLIVDIGYYKDGVVYDDELLEMTSDYQLDVEIKLVVLGFKEDGQVILSETKAMAEFGAKILDEAEESGAMVEAKIVSIAKGGYKVSVSGISGYLPFSLYQKGFLENPEEHLGEKTMLKIERHDKRGYVFTRLAYDEKLTAERASAFLNEHAIGEVVSGKLVAFNKGGVVVDVDGMRGFIPRSEISYSRSAKAEDILNKGDILELLIREFDQKKNNLILSLKDTLIDPWQDIDSEIAVGDSFELMPEGENDNLYFYELIEGVRGSIYKDKLPADMQKMDVEHEVIVANINYKKRRVELDYNDNSYQYENDDSDMGNTLGALFGDKLKSLNLE